jgi:hypothetical protein
MVGEYLGGFGIVLPRHPVPELWVNGAIGLTNSLEM